MALSKQKIALVSPGAMGASVGGAAVSGGYCVTWLDAGRGAETRARAERAGLVATGTASEFFGDADVLLSVCPPHLANEVADTAIDYGFRGLYLEGNAISPGQTVEIAARLGANHVDVVDGGIIGGPAWKTEFNTRLYLSGERAGEIAAVFEGSPLHTRELGDKVGDASALKMVFAAYSKGSTALLTAIMAVAENLGVREHLQAQWGEAFTTGSERSVTGSVHKAWRFAGEMEEIAATFSEAGLPPGFHLAAAEVFSRLSEFKDVAEPPGIEAVLAVLERE